MPNWKQTFVDLVEDINPMWRAEMELNGEWEEMKEYAVELATERWEFLTGPNGTHRDANGRVMAREIVTSFVLEDLIPRPSSHSNP